MASNNKSSNQEENKKAKKKIKAAEATPTKKTPQKSPINRTPNQDKDKKKKKTGNGRVTESPEVTVISSSSCDSQSQDIQPQNTPTKTQPKKNHTSKTSKPNKRKQNNDEDEQEGDATMCKFPMARIKRIIKSEDSALQLPQDVVFLVNKATEKFIEQFCEEAYDCSVQDRKKALAYKHLASAVSKSKRFDFLSDYVPVKLKAEVALEQRKLVENGET